MSASIIRPSEKRDVYEPCCSLLEQLHCQVYRLSQARASQQTPGLPDLLAFQPTWYGAQLICVETKVPGGRQRPAQREFQAWCVKAGIAYRLVSDPQHLADWLGRKTR